MLENKQSQQGGAKQIKKLTNFNIKKNLTGLYNPTIRLKCREELERTFNWKGSTFHNYMTVGINPNSFYIPKILEIIEKYKIVEKRYLEKKEELDDIINSLN